MNKVYKKNELGFALLWIGLYVVLTSLAESISAELGTAKLLTAPLHILMTVFLAVWIVKNNLGEKYGLVKTKIDYRAYLYFLPLAVISSTNLWGGALLRYSAAETVLFVVSMLCVGFLEEVIFRGLLFKAMCQTNVRRAVIISSVTFGIGHIVNLLNGRDIFETSLQICYAIAIGFLFTIIFLKSKSLIPCVVTHSIVNSLSAFAGERTEEMDIIIAVVLTVIPLLYAAWIIRNSPKTNT